MSDHLDINTPKTIWNRYKNSPAAIALTYISFLLIVTLLLITPTYDTNDDPAMGLTVSGYGNINGPDEHLLYTNIVIGIVLKHLYVAAPLIPWYGLYLLSALFLANWLLLYALLLLNRNYLSILGFTFFYMVVSVYFLTHLQFTSTAFLLGMAGLVLILSSVILDSKGTHFAWLKWEGALCLIASSLIRYSSLQMLILLALPLLLVCCFQYFKLIKFKSYVIPGTFAIIGVVSFHLYDQHYYQQDDDWKSFIQSHAAIAKVVNYAQIPYTDQTKPIFNEVGWSAFDYWMLRNWIYLDPETYSLSRVQKFQERIDELSLRKFPQVMQVRIHTARSAFINPTFLFCFVGSIVLMWQNKKCAWKRRTVIGMLLWTVLLMLGLVIYMKLPERVYIPLISFPLFISLFFAVGQFRDKDDYEVSTVRSSLKYIILILVLTSCFLTWNQKQRSDRIVRSNLRFKQDLKQIYQQMPNKIFLAVATFPIERMLPLDNQSEINNLKYLWLTGRQNSPLFQEKMREYQIRSPFRELYETERLLLIFHPKMNPILKGYLKQHYGVDVTLQSVMEGGYFHIYKVSKEQEEPVEAKRP